MGAKTGIAHRALRPTLGIVDPDNTRTLPPVVAASTGLDVLCHAVESFTALPYTAREAPAEPALRPAYQGANPISDLWAERAIELVARHLTRAMRDPDDDEARSAMLLAATFAGYGFGNAGVHLPHGMSYPVSSMVASRQTAGAGCHPAGYPDDHPMCPHGMSVILNAPAVFRFTACADPQRHLRAARLNGCRGGGRRSGRRRRGARRCHHRPDARRRHARRAGRGRVHGTAHSRRWCREPCRSTGSPSWRRAPASEADLSTLFAAALRYW